VKPSFTRKVADRRQNLLEAGGILHRRERLQKEDGVRYGVPSCLGRKGGKGVCVKGVF